MTDLAALLQPCKWEVCPGATEDELVEAEGIIGVPLPEDLKEVLRWSNGGKGWIGTDDRPAFFWLHSTVEIAQDYRDGFCAFHGVVLIGTNGSREHFALDYREDPQQPRLVALDLTQDHPESILAVGTSFGHGLRRLAAGESYFNEPAAP